MDRKAYPTSFTQQSGDPHPACIELGNALHVEFGQLIKPDHKNCLYPITVVRRCRSNAPIVQQACKDATTDKERDNEKTLNYGNGAGNAVEAVHGKDDGDCAQHDDHCRGDNAQAVPQGRELPKRSAYP